MKTAQKNERASKKRRSLSSLFLLSVVVAVAAATDLNAVRIRRNAQPPFHKAATDKEIDLGLRPNISLTDHNRSLIRDRHGFADFNVADTNLIEAVHANGFAVDYNGIRHQSQSVVDRKRENRISHHLIGIVRNRNRVIDFIADTGDCNIRRNNDSDTAFIRRRNALHKVGILAIIHSFTYF